MAVVVVSGAGATAPPHCDFASAPTVSAPRLRSDTSVGFTEPGRLPMWVSSCPIAFSALPQSPADKSEDAALSEALSELASVEESRPVLAPQATRNAAARPSPPAE